MKQITILVDNNEEIQITTDINSIDVLIILKRLIKILDCENNGDE